MAQLGSPSERGQWFDQGVAAVLDQAHVAMRERFDQHAPWRACGDCALVPVCGGGCSVAAHNEQGNLGVPSCHRPSMLAALDDIAASAQ